MGHPLAPFICQRGENTQPVQLICNMCRTEPLQAFPENVLYHIGGILVNLQALVLVTGLDVAIDSESPDKIAAAIKAGMRRVVVPRDNYLDRYKSLPIDVRPVDSFKDALSFLADTEPLEIGFTSAKALSARPVELDEAGA